MKTPPEILSPKDCLYITDLLEMTLTVSKKADDCSKSIKSKSIANAAHKNHNALSAQYDELLGSLKLGG